MSAEQTNVPPQRLKFGEALRDLRRRAGLSGEALAIQIGASQPKVSRLERGRQVATLEEVTAWARATGASRDELAHLLEQLQDVGTEFMQWKYATRRGIQQKQAEIQGFEATARKKRNFQPSLVPGLLQVPQYARPNGQPLPSQQYLRQCGKLSDPQLPRQCRFPRQPVKSIC
jgi:transcriptional regulator with XRE-family HTH domain